MLFWLQVTWWVHLIINTFLDCIKNTSVYAFYPKILPNICKLLVFSTDLIKDILSNCVQYLLLKNGPKDPIKKYIFVKISL